MQKLPRDVANAVVDSRTYADYDRLHAILSDIRANKPLAWAEPDDFEPFWFVSRYEDVKTVSRKNSLFTSGAKQTILMDNGELAQVKAMTGGSPHHSLDLIHMDGPQHSKFRQLTQGWFQPATLRQRDDRLKAVALEFVDRLAALNGRADFASDIAFRYPLRVIMQILGVPADEEPLILKWTLQLFASDDPDLNRTGASSACDKQEQLRAQFAAASEMAAYMGRLREMRIEKPTDDLSSVIANGMIDGERIIPALAVAYYMIVATAGHDTTASSIACGMWALTQNAELLLKLRRDPALIPGFVEESVRWATPVKHFLRSASETTELRDQSITAGDLLMLSYPSANRDESVFERPFDFDIERQPNAQIAFGYGGHTCLGQFLARTEMINFWEVALPRLNYVKAAGPVRLAASRLAGGIKSLPIRFEMS